MTKSFILPILCMIIQIIHSVTFEGLFNKQLKSSYGFEILKYYHQENFGDNDVKKFKGQSLLYMAPWKPRGAQIALKYINKFDYFVPCYYELQKLNNPDRISLVNNSYNEQYLRKIKQTNPKIKILPRVFIHGTQGDVFYMAGFDEAKMVDLQQIIRSIVMNELYDGIVLISTFITPNSKFPWSMRDIIKAIRSQTQIYNKLLFIGLQGVDNKPDRVINKKKARDIIDLADKIIVSNYDYPKGTSGGVIPVSPMSWLKQNYDFYAEVYSKSKLRSKLIMALPLYGYYVALFGKYDPLDAQAFLRKLDEQKQAYMSWVQEYEQCMISLNKYEFLFFPCLHFFDVRLKYLEQIGVGFAGYQVGSTLEIFFQMF